MSKQYKQYDKLVTPFAPCKYVYIEEGYKASENATPKKKITLILDPNIEEHKNFLTEMKEATAQLAGANGSPPFSKDYYKDTDGNKVYTDLWQLKMHTFKQVTVFDCAKPKPNVISGDFGDGSVVRAYVSLNPYDAFGNAKEGMNLYLMKVQVKEWVASDAVCPFDDVEGGFTDEGYVAPENSVSTPARDDTIPDDLPF